MAHHTHVETRTQSQYEYDRKKNTEHLKKQIVQFAIMIFLTLIAFASVLMDGDKRIVIPILLALAGVQVVQQLYSFMHMEDRNTVHMGVIEFFMWSGIFIAFTFFVAFTTIIWW